MNANRKEILYMIARKAIFILAVALFFGMVFAPRAKSAELRFEGTFGKTQYHLMQDGQWYQSPFAHSEQFTPNSGFVGISGKLKSGSAFGWRVSAVDLGKLSGEATFTTDEAFNAGTVTQPLGHGDGSGHYYGVTLAPTFEYAIGKDAAIGAEIGAFWYHGYWTESGTAPETALPFSISYHESGIKPYAGITARYGLAFVSLRNYHGVSIGAENGKETQQLTAGISYAF